MPRDPNRVQPKPVDVVRRRRRAEPRPLPVAEPEFHSTYRYYCRTLDGGFYTILCRNGSPTGDPGQRHATPAAAAAAARRLNVEELGYPEKLA